MICGCFMGLTSLILMFMSMSKMNGFRNDFNAVMDKLEDVNFEVKTVQHEDFRGLVHVIIDKDVFHSEDSLWDEDYSGGVNWLSGRYMEGEKDRSPADFKKSRRTYMVLASINLVFYSFILFFCQVVKGGGEEGTPQALSVVTFILKGLVFLCQYQIMMPYTVAQKHEGELILFYIPGTLLIVHAVLYGLCFCCLGGAVATQEGAAGLTAGGFFLIFMFIAGIPLYAVSYDYLPSYVNTMHEDYSEEMLFNTEYFDKSWLVQEYLMAGLVLDLVAPVLDVCIDGAFFAMKQ